MYDSLLQAAIQSLRSPATVRGNSKRRLKDQQYNSPGRVLVLPFTQPGFQTPTTLHRSAAALAEAWVLWCLTFLSLSQKVSLERSPGEDKREKRVKRLSLLCSAVLCCVCGVRPHIWLILLLVIAPSHPPLIETEKQTGLERMKKMRALKLPSLWGS